MIYIKLSPTVISKGKVCHSGNLSNCDGNKHLSVTVVGYTRENWFTCTVFACKKTPQILSYNGVHITSLKDVVLTAMISFLLNK